MTALLELINSCTIWWSFPAEILLLLYPEIPASPIAVQLNEVAPTFPWSKISVLVLLHNVSFNGVAEEVGGIENWTVTWAIQDKELPLISVAVRVTKLIPSSEHVKTVFDVVSVRLLQLSVLPPSIELGFKLNSPVTKSKFIVVFLQILRP